MNDSKIFGDKPSLRSIESALISIPALFLAIAFSSPAYSHGQGSELAELPPSADIEFPPADAVPMDVTGRLTVLHLDDFKHGKSKYEVFLEDASKNAQFNLKFKGELPSNLQTGATVRVQGLGKGKEIYLQADSGSSIQTLAPAVAVVSGEQKTLVLVTNFTDAMVSCPVADVEKRMFTDPYDKSIDDLYQETSFGNVSFSGQVATVNINVSSADACNLGNWATKADTAAQAANIDVGAYARKVYVMPSTNSCGYAGVGQVGGSPSQAWIFRCDLPDVFAHELGHNLGMAHAATPTSEYGDVSDVMGGSGRSLRQVNSPHKEQMGWMPPENIAAVTNGGTYSIAPLELDPTDAFYPQTLKIVKPDTGDYYYLSYRQPIGFDANLSSANLNSLVIHRYKGDGLAHNTFLLTRLTDGGSYTDSINGITVTQVSHDSTRVNLQVQMGSSCQAGAPAVAITPSAQSGTPGTTLSYGVMVTNSDWSSCPQSKFNLAGSFPSGWSGTVSPSSLTLTPGQSASATVSVTSPATASGGSYAIAVATSDVASALHNKSATGTYSVTVPTGDSQPPTVPTSLSASVKRSQISLVWSASSDNVGVSGYQIWRNNVKIGTVSGTSYADTAVSSGSTYIYSVTAFDAAGNVSSLSPSVTATFQASGSGGKGNNKI
jgi:hypothetical protein